MFDWSTPSARSPAIAGSCVSSGVGRSSNRPWTPGSSPPARSAAMSASQKPSPMRGSQTWPARETYAGSR